MTIDAEIMSKIHVGDMTFKHKTEAMPSWTTEPEEPNFQNKQAWHYNSFRTYVHVHEL